MAKLGLQKPNKLQIINAGASTFGAVAGYQGYEIAAQRLPITKEMNLGLFGASIVGQTMLKGTGMIKTLASALLIGVAINTGITAAEDYGVMKAIYPAASPVGINAEELNGAYGFNDQPVEYIEDGETYTSPEYQLASAETSSLYLM